MDRNSKAFKLGYFLTKSAIRTTRNTGKAISTGSKTVATASRNLYDGVVSAKNDEFPSEQATQRALTGMPVPSYE